MPNPPGTPYNYGSDDIYQMAAQAGIVPPPPQPPQPGIDPATISPEVMGGGLTPPAGPETVTAPTAPEPDPGLVPGHMSSGQSMSQSEHGYSPSKMVEVNKTDADLNRANAASAAEVKAGYAPAQAAYDKAQGEKVAAAKSVGAAKVAADLAQGQDDTAMAAIHNGFKDEEARLSAAATAEANTSKANYIASLADLRASRVDPAQLWGNMSGGQKFGMLVSAFVTDFLGARGIHTSAMETFNKAIDRNIDAQVQAIKTKGDVSEGFKSLWYMQRSQANSDAEARTRVRGHLLEGAKAAAAAHMSKYSAGLASAQAGAAMAELDGASADNMLKVNKDITDATTARYTQNVANANSKRDAAMSAYATASANKRAQDAANAARGPADPTIGLLHDTGTGFATMIRKGDTQDKDWGELLKQRDETKDIQAETTELMALQREYGHLGIADKTRWANSNASRINAMAGDILERRSLLLTGKQGSDSERKIIGAATPEAKFLGTLDVLPTLAQTSRRMGDLYNTRAHTLARELPPGDPRRQIHEGAAHDNSALRNANLDTETGADIPKRTAADAVFEHMATKDTGKPPPDSLYEDTGIAPEALKAAYGAFGEEHKQAAQAAFDSAAASKDTEGMDAAREALGALAEPKSYVLEVAALRDAGVAGNQKALTKLVEIATSDPSDPKHNDPNLTLANENIRRAWAQYELHSLLAETNDLKKMGPPQPTIMPPAAPPVVDPADGPFVPAQTKYVRPRGGKFQ